MDNAFATAMSNLRPEEETGMSDGFVKTIQDIRDKTNELGFQNKQIDGDTLNTWQKMLRTRPVRLLIERLLGRSAVHRAIGAA